MKFFVPFTIGISQAEQIYDCGKKRLERIGFRISQRRINTLAYWCENRLACQQVGDRAPNGEVIAAIFESDVGYFVSTYAAIDELTEPMSLHYTMLIMSSSVQNIDSFDSE